MSSASRQHADLAVRRTPEEPAPAAPPAGRLARGGWWRRRPTAAAALLYAVLAVLMVGQGLLPGRTLSDSDYLWSTTPWSASRPADVRGLGSNFELADQAQVLQPFVRHTRGELPHIPLWNTHIMGGRPFLANAQSAVFSPFTVPSYVLPYDRSMAVVAALKLFVAALGAFVLARALRMGAGGALLAGTVYGFGLFMVVWLPWPLTNVFPLIPWILLACDAVARRPGPLPGAALAALVGLQFLGGHPETSFHVVVVACLWFAFRLLVRRHRERLRPRALVPPVAVFAAAGVGGAALAALTLLPLVEFLSQSADLQRRMNQPPGHTPAKYLGAIFLPDYWGRPTQQVIEPFLTVRAYYAGALTLMLAATALLLRPRSVQRWALAALGAGVAALAVGMPVLFGAVTALPGFRTAHNSRMVIFLLLALALLAGFGLDDLVRRRPRDRRARRVVVGAAGLLLLAPVAWMAVAGTLAPTQLGEGLRIAWGFEDPPPIRAGLGPLNGAVADAIRMSSLLIWLPIAAAGLALIALRLRVRRPLAPGLLVGLAVALVAVDLFRAGMGFNPAIPTRNAHLPATGAIRHLQAERPMRFVGVGAILSATPIPPDTAMDWDLYDARGYDFPVARRYDRLWRTRVAPPVPESLIPPHPLVDPKPRALRALSLLSVRSLIQDPRDKPLAGLGLRLAYSAGDARVYENPHALPRVFVVGAQRTVAGGDAALDAATARNFDARRTAITERPLPGLPQGAAPGGSARLLTYDDERVVAESRSVRPGVLVLTDVHFPGWRAEVDGRRVGIEQVDYLLRGVPVPAGRHRVELTYEPASWRIGWIVSLLALGGLVATVAAGLRARRR